jgi:hypothetical protein
MKHTVIPRNTSRANDLWGLSFIYEQERRSLAAFGLKILKIKYLHAFNVLEERNPPQNFENQNLT